MIILDQLLRIKLFNLKVYNHYTRIQNVLKMHFRMTENSTKVYYRNKVGYRNEMLLNVSDLACVIPSSDTI